MSDETDVTDSPTPSTGVTIEERLDVLEDAVGTSNRLARKTWDEVSALKWTILFSTVLLVALYVKNGKAV